MSKLAKKAITVMLAAVMAVTLFLEIGGVEAQAYEDPVYSNPATDANGIYIASKCKVYVKSTSDITNGLYVSLPEGATIKSVKSSSSKLKTNIIRNAYSIPYTYASTYVYTDGTPTEKYEGNGTTTRDSAWIGLYATKKGTYKLTVNITLADKKTVTKKVTVKAVTENYDYYCTYSGYTYDDDGYIKTTEKSGKLKIKAGPDIKIQKIEFANKFDSAGDPIFKKISNNKKVTLNQKKTRAITSSFYTSQGNNYTYTSTSKYSKPITYSYLFAYSVVRVSYKDKWTGNVYDVDDANNDGYYASTQYIYYIK